MSLALTDYVIVASLLFCISMTGLFINRRNMIVLLMSIELLLLSANFLFVAFSKFSGDASGQLFVFFILAVAAAESAIGLAILVLVYRNRKTINVDQLNKMRG